MSFNLPATTHLLTGFMQAFELLTHLVKGVVSICDTCQACSAFDAQPFRQSEQFMFIALTAL